MEDSQHRLKWVAYLEFTHNEQVEDLTWDKVSHIARKKTHGYPTKASTNQPVQSKKTRNLKFGICCAIHKVKKGTDQLCSYCTAALFLLMQKAGNGSVNLNSKA